MRPRLAHARAVLRTPITGRQLGIIVVSSLVATVVIILAGTGSGQMGSAAFAAALRGGNYVVRVGANGAATPADTAGSTVSSGSSSARAAQNANTSTDSSAPYGGVDTSSLGLATDTTPTDGSSSPPPAAKPAAGHVFVISLSTGSFEAAFGNGSAARYLNRTLRPQGTFLGGYESLGSNELPDLLAMVSGQPPNPATQAGCSTFADFDTGAKPGADGIVAGSGCVYPNTALTVADQVTSAGKSWRAYVEGIGSTACPHPDSGAPDTGEPTGAQPQYDTRHNPFIYFHSLLDLGGCASNDVSIKQLAGDLRRDSGTPAYAFLAPGLCADGAASSCAAGGPSGLAAEDGFLRRWVPRILRSPAYRKDGVLIVAFALASSGNTGSAPTGALVLSPHTAKGKTVSTAYDAYSVVRTTEDLLGLKPLAKAARAKSFARLAGG